MIHHRNEMRAFALKILLAAGSIPMSTGVLREKLRTRFGFIPLAELDEVIRSLEEEGYSTGTTSQFAGTVVWMLTDKGRIQAQQLP